MKTTKPKQYWVIAITIIAAITLILSADIDIARASQEPEAVRGNSNDIPEAYGSSVVDFIARYDLADIELEILNESIDNYEEVVEEIPDEEIIAK